MNFIFWNTNKNKSINPFLEDMILEHRSNVVILAEYKDNENVLCNSLYLKGMDFNTKANIGGCPRIKILFRLNPIITHFSETEYYTIKNIKLRDLDIILACVHFPSLLFNNDANLEGLARELIIDIEKVEEYNKHSNTIIVGDFNANPFNNSVINAGALHGIPTRDVAKKKCRSILSTRYKMFYNPMWNLFGDLKGVPGTYYYNNGNQCNFYWNMFDQVILRPSMIDLFDLQSLKIITTINGNTLLKNNVPNIEYSDHLPISFSLNS